MEIRKAVFSMNSNKVLDQMENQRFIMGFQDDNNKDLFLKAWENICTLRLAGGQGFRRAKDMKIDFASKLPWNLCTDIEKLYIRMHKTKYLKEDPLNLVWCPSKLGLFSVRSMYRNLQKNRLSNVSLLNKNTWKHLWHSKLHNR